VIPAEIRYRFNLTPSARPDWVIEGDALRLHRVKSDRVAAFRGHNKGGATRRLIANRKEDAKPSRPISFSIHPHC